MLHENLAHARIAQQRGGELQTHRSDRRRTKVHSPYLPPACSPRECSVLPSPSIPTRPNEETRPMYPNVKLLIDGQWCDSASGATLLVLNPATGETIGTVAHAARADLDRALEAA